MGVAILKGKFEGKILKSRAHVFGSWVILTVEIIDTVFILGNISGTNNSLRNKALFQQFEEDIFTFMAFPGAKLILGENVIKDLLHDSLLSRPMRDNNCRFWEFMFTFGLF